MPRRRGRRRQPCLQLDLRSACGASLQLNSPCGASGSARRVPVPSPRSWVRSLSNSSSRLLPWLLSHKNLLFLTAVCSSSPSHAHPLVLFHQNLLVVRLVVGVVVTPLACHVLRVLITSKQQSLRVVDCATCQNCKSNRRGRTWPGSRSTRRGGRGFFLVAGIIAGGSFCYRWWWCCPPRS